MRRASALVSLAVMAAWSAPAVASDRPRPGQPGSYATYAQVIDDARDRALKQVLAVYDAAVARNPSDDIAAVERCRLLEAVLGRDEEDAPPNDPRQACRDGLIARYPRSPSALFFRLERAYGKERVDLLTDALQRRDIDWSDSERAELHRELAVAYEAQKNAKGAVAEAHLALAIDPTIDLSLIIGRELLAQGRTTEAIVQLSRPASSPNAGHLRGERARLLGEAGAPLRGLALLEPSHIAWPQLGLLYEQAGKLDQADAAYAQLPESPRHTALARVVQKALAGSDPGAADRAYQTLRDMGWRADPYGGYRLALARRFPSLPWRRRDAAGVAVFLLAIVAFFLAPALWVVPLHHWSLWRRLRHTMRLPPPTLVTRWRLTQLWLGCAALLVAQLVSYVVFNYADATAQWWRSANEKLPHVTQEVARLGLSVVLGEVALLVLLVVRRRDLRLFGPGRWTVRKSVSRAALTVLAFFTIALLWLLLVRWRGAASPATLTIEELVLALRQTYGLAVVVLLIVVLGPIAEELVFRSLLLDVLARSMPFWVANALQALVFAAAHGEPKKMIYLFGVGLLCGLLRARSGGLLASITFHMLNNLFATIAALNSVAAPAVAPVAASPSPLMTMSAELQACVDGAPEVKDAKPQTAFPPPVVLNNAAWRIALDPQASPTCLRDALDAIDRALTELPERAGLLDTEATVLYRQDRLDEAIDLERLTIERFKGSAVHYAQLGRFLSARRERSGPLAFGAGAAKDVHIGIVDVSGGQALQVDLGAGFPDGVTLYYRVIGDHDQPSLLRVQIGPPTQRSFRLEPDHAALQLDAKKVRFELLLIDSRGCEGCGPGYWYWTLQFPNKTVAGYP